MTSVGIMRLNFIYMLMFSCIIQLDPIFKQLSEGNIIDREMFQ